MRAGRDRSRKPLRTGAALVLVLTCLSVVMMLLFSVVKSTLLTAQRLRTEHASRAAEWLLQAGAARAQQQLAAHADYAGEPWTLPIHLAGEEQVARIQIEVVPTLDASLRRVQLRAECQSFRGLPVVRSKRVYIKIQLPPTGESS